MGTVDQTIFKRYEVKFLITHEQKERLIQAFGGKIEHDEYSFSSVRSLYYDTPDFLLARRSLEKPVYKEKLRVRSYGEADENSKVFVELKKKYDSVVYKRRIVLEEENAMEYLEGTKHVAEGQISQEIDYFLAFYGNLKPAVFLSYDREAFRGAQDSNLRLTFDENILYRKSELNLCAENYGKRILPQDAVLLEVKVPNAFPLWMTEFLSREHIYKTSFSKYGQAYVQMIRERESEISFFPDRAGVKNTYGIGELYYA